MENGPVGGEALNEPGWFFGIEAMAEWAGGRFQDLLSLVEHFQEAVKLGFFFEFISVFSNVSGENGRVVGLT